MTHFCVGDESLCVGILNGDTFRITTCVGWQQYKTTLGKQLVISIGGSHSSESFVSIKYSLRVGSGLFQEKFYLFA